MAQKISISNFPAVSYTALVPLYCKAMDYRSKNSVLNDKFSYDLYNQIEFDWDIVKSTVRSFDPVLIGIRVRKFDRMCRQFLERYPHGIIVSLGSGIDYRFGRIDNGQCCFVDLDFPEVMEFRKAIMPASKRNVLIEQSVLDYSWITRIKELSDERHAPVFFIAESLMQYLEITEIRTLLTKMQQAFPQMEIFFDVFNERAKKLTTSKPMFKDFNVKIKSGIDSGKVMEEWGIGFKVLSEWYLSDDPDAKRGLMKLFWIVPSVKKLQIFVHGNFEKQD